MWAAVLLTARDAVAAGQARKQVGGLADEEAVAWVGGRGGGLVDAPVEVGAIAAVEGFVVNKGKIV